MTPANKSDISFLLPFGLWPKRDDTPHATVTADGRYVRGRIFERELVTPDAEVHLIASYK